MDLTNDVAYNLGLFMGFMFPMFGIVTDRLLCYWDRGNKRHPAVQKTGVILWGVLIFCYIAGSHAIPRLLF
jgi:hypothetical protein